MLLSEGVGGVEAFLALSLSVIPGFMSIDSYAYAFFGSEHDESIFSKYWSEKDMTDRL